MSDIIITQLGGLSAVGQGYPVASKSGGSHTLTVSLSGIGALVFAGSLMGSNDNKNWVIAGTVTASGSGSASASAQIAADYAYWALAASTLTGTGVVVSGVLTTEASVDSISAFRQALASSGVAPSRNLSSDGRSGGLDDASSWTRHGRTLAVADSPALTMYWPSTIETSRIASPLDKYYQYYSTDHGASTGTPTGNIYLQSGPTPYGPWTQRGVVYVDLTGGNETETPSVYWDEGASAYRMTYQQGAAVWGPGNATAAIGQQSTLSCTSTDGVAWTKDTDFIIDIPALADVHGDGHCGYFLPFKTRHGLFAYSLHGGTTGADCVLWQQRGRGNKWVTNRIPLGYGMEQTLGLAYNKVEWNHSFVVQSGGVDYLVGLLSNGAAGGSAKDARIFVAPVSADYRSLAGKPSIIWTPTESWESADIRSVMPFIDQGRLYLTYTIAKNSIGCISHAL